MVLDIDGGGRSDGRQQLCCLVLLRGDCRPKPSGPVLGRHSAISATGPDDGGGGVAAGVPAARTEIPPQHAEFSDSAAVVDLHLHVADLSQ